MFLKYKLSIVDNTKIKTKVHYKHVRYKNVSSLYSHFSNGLKSENLLLVYLRKVSQKFHQLLLRIKPLTNKEFIIGNIILNWELIFSIILCTKKEFIFENIIIENWSYFPSFSASWRLSFSVIWKMISNEIKFWF